MAKTIKTAEQIVEVAIAKSTTVRGARRIIARMFRRQDDSDLWPISGKFNVVERAIRHARDLERMAGEIMDDLAYALFLEDDMSRIVNDSRNW